MRAKAAFFRRSGGMRDVDEKFPAMNSDFVVPAIDFRSHLHNLHFRSVTFRSVG
jgi:hypothetical protein